MRAAHIERVQKKGNKMELLARATKIKFQVPDEFIERQIDGL